MRIIAFHQSVVEQYNGWALSDKKTFERLQRLIAEPARTPFAESGSLNHLNANSKDIGHAGLPASTACL